jgi:catechol 2,3-dioxygenase-like lactoylglutathione lyase family enzyme
MATNRIRGIDHIGVTVLNIEEAEKFLFDAFDAEFIYETLNRTMPPFEGPETEHMTAGPPGLSISRIRMYKLGTGPTLELFEYDNVDSRRPPLRGCDLGWQHIALYVDDMDAALTRAVAAGAEKMSDPWDLVRAESGPGNKFCFIRAPWGALIELITYPSPQPYEQDTDLRRWKPSLSYSGTLVPKDRFL